MQLDLGVGRGSHCRSRHCPSHRRSVLSDSRPLPVQNTAVGYATHPQLASCPLLARYSPLTNAKPMLTRLAGQSPSSCHSTPISVIFLPRRISCLMPLVLFYPLTLCHPWYGLSIFQQPAAMTPSDLCLFRGCEYDIQVRQPYVRCQISGFWTGDRSSVLSSSSKFSPQLISITRMSRTRSIMLIYCSSQLAPSHTYYDNDIHHVPQKVAPNGPSILWQRILLGHVDQVPTQVHSTSPPCSHSWFTAL